MTFQTSTLPIKQEIERKLIAQGERLGYDEEDLIRAAKEHRLVWDEEVYGRCWRLNGKIILMWNSIEGRFVVPEMI